MNKIMNKNVPDFKEYILKYLKVYEKIVKEEKIQRKYAGVYRYLFQEIYSLSALTLVYELNLMRNENKLIGKDKYERYKYYISILDTDDFHDYLNKKYPVLHELILSKIKNTAHFIKNIENNYLKNIEIIRKKFNISNTEIKDIFLGQGDMHNEGQTVAIIQGENWKLVYKPHDLLNDEIYEMFLNMINKTKHLKLNLIHLKYLTFEDHGWQEYIENKECKETNQISNYYYRLGSHLAILFFLNSTDMHYENIIANGEYPIFIDTETLVNNGNITKEMLEKPELLTLFNSILYTSILPNNNPLDPLDVDMSGYLGGRKTSKRFKTFVYENLQTDELIIRKKDTQLKPGLKNFPKLNGINTDPILFLEDLINGFDETYDALIECKDTIKEIIDSKIMKKTKQRQLMRHTMVYGKFIEAGHHPLYLTSFKKRHELMNILLKKGKNDDRIFSEIQMLDEDQIPYYYSEYLHKDLKSQNRIIIQNYFEVSGKDVLDYKLKSLTRQNKKFQINLIKMSVLGGYEKKDLLTKSSLGKQLIEKKTNKMYVAKSILNKYLENIVFDFKYNKHNIVLPKLYDGKYFVSNLDLDLYENGGVIWGIYCMAKELNDKKLLDLCNELIDEAELHFMNTESNISSFAGLGSRIYIYHLFYLSSNKDDYYIKYRKYLDKLEKRIQTEDIEIDFLNGISGVLTILINIYKYDKAQYLERIISKSKFLFNKKIKERTPKPGVGHGDSGLSLALIKLYAYTSEDLYLDRAKELVLSELHNIDYSVNTWCKGTMGILLVTNELLKYVKKEDKCFDEIIKLYHNTIDKILSSELLYLNNMCLCHGTIGNIVILNVLKDCKYILNRQKEMIFKILDEVEYLVNTESIDLNMKYNLPIYSFMDGLAGVMYGLLLLKNHNYPNPLLLEIKKV